MPFWKKKPRIPSSLAIWNTAGERDRGLLKEIHGTASQAIITLVVSHFPDQHRWLADILEQAGIPHYAADGVGDLRPATLANRSAGGTVALIPFDLVTTAGTPAEESANSNQQVRILIPEVHPAAGPDQTVGQWAATLPFPSELLRCTSFDSVIMRSTNTSGVRDILDKLGMEDGERLEHRWLSQLVEKSQKQNAAKASGSTPADSAAEWIQKNLS